MTLIERIVAKCDYCNEEVVISGPRPQVRSVAEAEAALTGTECVPGTHITIPKGWKFVHGEYVCPKHIVTVSEK